jgi:YD repeat-containing protein
MNSGRLAFIENSGGEIWTVTYESGSDRVETIKDRFGRLTTFSYDGNDKLSGIQDPDGRTTSFSVVSNKLVSMTTPESCVFQFGYDATTHQLTSFTDAASSGRVTPTRTASANPSKMPWVKSLRTSGTT